LQELGGVQFGQIRELPYAIFVTGLLAYQREKERFSRRLQSRQQVGVCGGNEAGAPAVLLIY
jgi:hypothetical protein